MDDRKLVQERVNPAEIDDIDPLIIFRCKNPQCRQTFSPSSLMNVSEHKLYFSCPVCGSKYEAQYTEVPPFQNKEVILLLERPRMIYRGTRIASS